MSPRNVLSMIALVSASTIMLAQAQNATATAWAKMPTAVLATGMVADLLNPMPVSQQLGNGNEQGYSSSSSTVQYAWDAAKNCYAEKWFAKGSLFYMKSTCHNFTQIYDNTTGTNTCSGQNDNSTVVANNLKNL